jgi:tetraacyldisaccharide 4'-kinase
MKFPRALQMVLWPVSLLYRIYVRRRALLYARGWLKQRRLDAAVISVGNLTVGGTGKTPMVLWLAEKFLADGKKVAILSRGYRGSRGTSDEVELLKRRLKSRAVFGVGADRFLTGSRLQAEHGIDIFILDDGFQHLQLARDLDIVMLDGSRKLKEKWLLPAGFLREPISACERADILVVTRKFERPWTEAADAHRYSIFYAQTRLLGFRRFGADSTERYLSEINAGPFFAFCGIGNPDSFFADLARWRVNITGRKAFADHHRYSCRELAELQSVAKAADAAGLVTTEKDAENLPTEMPTGLPIWVAVIDLIFTAESELVAAIERKLAARSGVAA